MVEPKFKVKDRVGVQSLNRIGIVTSIYQSKQYPSGWTVIIEFSDGKCTVQDQDALFANPIIVLN